MRAPNHIAGGIVFTGTFASFWNVNIFSDWKYLAITVIASLLPDIDHTQSILGKMFYPLAKYLDRKFGHRTITHSLLFLIISCFIVFLIDYHTKLESILLIFFFALLSHLLFDMMTVQGIPLFYPFKRNPCVIPADPQIRIKGGSSQEIVVFAFFLLILWFSYPLFQNGFWLSYNNQFATIKHLNSSNRKTDYLLKVNYAFTDNSSEITGQGLAVLTEENKAVILDQKGQLLQINSSAVLKDLSFKNSDILKEYLDFNFIAIEKDSLSSILSEYLIISAQIYSNEKFLYKGKEMNDLTLKLEFSPQLLSIEKSNIQQQKLAGLKQAEIEHKTALLNDFAAKQANLEKERKTLQNSLKSPELSDYMKEKVFTSLKQIELEISKLSEPENDILKLKNELEIILKDDDKLQLFSGNVRKLKI